MPTQSLIPVEPSDVVDVWWSYLKPVTRTKRRNRKPSLRGAMAQAKRAGVDVAGATIAPDGSVELKFGPVPTPDAETKPKKINRWDEVLKRDPPQISIVKR